MPYTLALYPSRDEVCEYTGHSSFQPALDDLFSGYLGWENVYDGYFAPTRLGAPGLDLCVLPSCSLTRTA